MPGLQPVFATSARDFGPFVWLPLFGALQAVGVGIRCKNPDTLAAVRGAGIVCAQHPPPSIAPHFGQVAENSVESA
jgi:hypothetical protein